MKSRGRTAAAVTLLVAGMIAAPPARAEAPSAITLTLRHGRLSLEARDAPLQAIVDEITDRTGVRVRFDEGSAAALDPLVDIELHDVSVEDALRMLLRGRDLVFVYGTGRLAEARVYARSEAAAPPPAASVSSAGAPPDTTSLARLRSEALASPDPAVRGRALEGIAASGDAARTRDTVVAMLEREADANLLQRALDLVAEDRTIPLEPVMKLALSNPTPEVRIKALSHLGVDAERDGRARQALEVSAASDPAPGVRDAARALLQQLPPR